jgi:REP element-mobilizing transposase RayT
MVFHVLNRGVGRRTLFEKDADYLAFETVLEETLRIRPMRICAYCLMPNHWHFVAWPEQDGHLSAFMQQLTNTHMKRWKHWAWNPLCEIEEGQDVRSSHDCIPRFLSYPFLVAVTFSWLPV